MQYREAKTPASPGKVLSHLSIHHSEDGGHLVMHHYAEDGMMYHKPKEYNFGPDEGNDMLDHVRKHMHVSSEATVEKPDVEREAEEV